MPTGFHPHAHFHSLGGQVTVELLRFLAVLQSTLPAFPSFAIHKRNLLEARVIIASLYLCILFASARFGLSVLVGDWIGIRREAVHILRRSELAAWIIDRPPALLSQCRGESQAARACIQGRRERWYRVGEPKLSLIQTCEVQHA